MWCGVDGGGGGRGRGVWWGVGMEGSCGVVGSGTVVWWVGRYRRSSVMVRRGWRCWTGVNLHRILSCPISSGEGQVDFVFGLDPQLSVVGVGVCVRIVVRRFACDGCGVLVHESQGCLSRLGGVGNGRG